MDKAEFNDILTLIEIMNIYLKSGDYRCVVEALTDEYQFDDNKNRCFTTSENCGDCIARWLSARGKVMKFWIDCAELRSKVQQKMLYAMYKLENEKAQAYADVIRMIDEAECHVCKCEEAEK